MLGQLLFAVIEDCAVPPAFFFEARCAQRFDFRIGHFLASVKQQPAHLDGPVVMVRLLDAFQFPQQVSAAQTVMAAVVFEIGHPAFMHQNRLFSNLVMPIAEVVRA